MLQPNLLKLMNLNINSQYLNKLNILDHVVLICKNSNYVSKQQALTVQMLVKDIFKNYNNVKTHIIINGNEAIRIFNCHLLIKENIVNLDILQNLWLKIKV